MFVTPQRGTISPGFDVHKIKFDLIDGNVCGKSPKTHKRNVIKYAEFVTIFTSKHHFHSEL